MLLSTAYLAPRVSWHYRPLRKCLKKADKTRIVENLDRIRERPWREPGDALVVADALSHTRPLRAMAVLRIALRRWPQDPCLRLSFAAECLEWHHASRALAALSGLTAKTFTQMMLLQSLEAHSYSLLGRAKAARNRLDRRVLDEGEKDPIIATILGLCYRTLRDWDLALRWARQAYTLSPKSARIRMLLVDALLAVNAQAEADGILDRSIASADADHRELYLGAVSAFSRWQLDQARERLERAIAAGKDAQRHAGFRALLAWLADDHEAARRLAEAMPPAMAETFATANPEGKRRVLNGPLLCQEPLMCVPTSVAIIAAMQGKPLEPRQLFQSMKGFDGTELWRMCEVMAEHGFTTLPVRLTPEAIIEFIDHGLPLLAPIDYLFSAHVEIIVGYDQGLQRCIIRDPADWTPRLVSLDSLSERYANSDSSGLVLIGADNAVGLEIAQRWRAESYGKLLGLAKAIAENDLSQAAEHAAAIAPNSPLQGSKLNYMFGSLITPRQYREQTQALIRDRQHPLPARLRCLLSSGDPELVKTWLTEEGDELSVGGRRLLRLAQTMAERRWDEALAQVDNMLRHMPAAEDLWVRKAEILRELGRISDAWEAGEIAVEIAPKSLWLRRRMRSLFPYTQRVADALNEVDGLIAANPSQHELKEERAYLLGGAGDGLAYEAELRKATRYFPCKPELYQTLADWFLRQERQDLAAPVLVEANARMGDEEFPLPPWAGGAAPDPESAPREDPLVALRRLAFEGVASDNERWQALENELNDREHPWYTVAQIAAWRLVRQARCPLEPEPREWIFPTALPGIPLYALTAFLDALAILELPKALANAVHQWIQPQLKGLDWSPYLAFELAMLDEHRGMLQDAESQYATITQRAPAHAGAHFRLGRVLRQRGQWLGARRHFEQAVALFPDNLGALVELAEIAENLQEPKRHLHWLHAKAELHPYDQDIQMDHCRHVQSYQGREAALACLARLDSRLPAPVLGMLAARLALDADDAQTCREHLANLDTMLPGIARACRIMTIQLDWRDEAFASALNHLDAWLAEYPEDTWFLRTKGFTLEKLDPEKARAFYQDMVQRGQFDDDLVARFLSVGPVLTKDDLEVIVSNTEPAYRESLAHGLYQGLMHQGNGTLALDFLQSTVTGQPRYLRLRETLIYHLHNHGQTREAVHEAEQLYQDDNKEPRWLPLLATVYGATSIPRSLEFWKRAYSVSGSVHALSQIGYSYHVLGQTGLAYQYYTETLDRDPLHEQAMNNLLLLNFRPSFAYDALCKGVELGCGTGMPYYHVNAVKIANETRQPLPHSWGSWAEKRWQQMLNERPFRDEKIRLALALARWHQQQGELEKAKTYRRAAGSKRFTWKYWGWPGRKWLPSQLLKTPIAAV